MSGHKPWSEIEHKSERRKSVERAQTDEFIKAAARGVEAVRRKGIPVYSGFMRYFPDAILAVAELSRIGNDQHNPGAPLHWDRSKSGDELDAMLRHVLDGVRGEDVDSDGVLHKTKVAWRAMADLQKALENQRKIDAISEAAYHREVSMSKAELNEISDRIRRGWRHNKDPFEGDENSKPQKIAVPNPLARMQDESRPAYIERLNTGWNAI